MFDSLKEQIAFASGSTIFCTIAGTVLHYYPILVVPVLGSLFLSGYWLHYQWEKEQKNLGGTNDIKNKVEDL